MATASMDDGGVSRPSLPPGEASRRGVRAALRLGVIFLSTGAQAQEAERSLLEVMRAFGLRGGDAIVTSSSVTVSYVAPGDAETTTAISAVREWRYDLAQVAAAGALVRGIGEGRIDILAAEAELDRIAAMAPPYPAWLRFAAPALLSAAVTILFGGSIVDSVATLGIGVAIQPVLDRIERSSLPLFFQVVFGVSMTALLVVVLAGLRLPIDAGLVLTGGLLRFLPGAQLVNGMRDLIARAIVPGTANLAEVVLLGIAVAAAASLVLEIGQAILAIDLRLAMAGRHEWSQSVTVVAGSLAVLAYAVRLGVPRRAILTVALLGGLAVVIAEGMTPISAEASRNGRTLLAALAVGLVGRSLAAGLRMPGQLWLVPAILPLLPAPATLLPHLAGSDEVRAALQSQAFRTAFLIGVGVACGDILVTIWQASRTRAAALIRSSRTG